MNRIGLCVLFGVTALVAEASNLQNSVTIDVPGALNTFPLGVNTEGDVVGYFENSNRSYDGFFYSQASHTFNTFSFTGTGSTYAGGITDSGFIAGTFSTEVINTHIFLLSSDGSYQSFAYPGTGYLSNFVSINNVGELAGSFAPTGQDYQGFISSTAGSIITTFRVPGSSETEAFGINDSGQVVGRYETAALASIGFIRNADDTYTTFRAPGSASFGLDLTLPRGINDNGDVVGTTLTNGFLRTSDGVFYPIDLPPGTSTEPSAISNTDLVVGWYYDNNQYHGFLGQFSPVPEPASVTLLGLGVFLGFALSLCRRPNGIALT